MNKHKIISLIIAVVGTLGFIDAAYLSYMRAMKIPVPCSTSIFNGCHVVAQSEYSVLFGIPLSVYGVIFYAGAIVFALAYFFTQRVIIKQSLLAITILGLLSSVYFIYIQGFVIKSFCIYCVFSAFCSVVMSSLAVFLFRLKEVNTTTSSQS
jgi:uncharacterized membrane protein